MYKAIIKRAEIDKTSTFKELSASSEQIISLKNSETTKNKQATVAHSSAFVRGGATEQRWRPIRAQALRGTANDVSSFPAAAMFGSAAPVITARGH